MILIKKQKYCFNTAFFIWETVSTFSLYFFLGEIRSYFDSQKGRAGLEVRSHEEIDTKSQKISKLLGAIGQILMITAKIAIVGSDDF